MAEEKSKGGTMDAIRGIYASHISFKETKERERTKRKLSEDRKEEYLADIKMKRDVILTALKNYHELNQLKLLQLFKVIALALESGNLDMLGNGLSVMVKIAETSSLVSFSDLSKKLENKNNVIDI